MITSYVHTKTGVHAFMQYLMIETIPGMICDYIPDGLSIVISFLWIGLAGISFLLGLIMTAYFTIMFLNRRYAKIVGASNAISYVMDVAAQV
jgi:hypothetical protein